MESWKERGGTVIGVLHLNIKIRIYCAFLGDFFSAMILPFMTIYFAERIGTIYTGTLIIFGVVVRLTGSIIGGYYSDNNGRKPVIIASEVVLVVSYVLLFWANWNSNYFFIVLSAIAYLFINACMGAYEPAIDGMILDLTPQEQRKKVYAIFYWVYNLSVAFGGILGSFLFRHHLLYLLAFCVAGYLLILITTIFFIGETCDKAIAQNKKTNQPDQSGIIRSYISVFKNKLFMLFILASLLIISIEFHLNNYIGVRLETEIKNQTFLIFNLSGIELLGFLKTENTLLILLMGVILNKLGQRKNDKPLLFIGFMMYIMGFGAISYFNSIGVLFIAMLIATLGEIIYIPIRQSYMVGLIPSDKRSSYMAVHSSIRTLSLLIASMLLMLAEYASKGVISLLIVLGGLSGLVLFFIIIQN